MGGAQGPGRGATQGSGHTQTYLTAHNSPRVEAAKCPSVDEQITAGRPCGILFSHEKEQCSACATAQRSLGNITPDEKSQVQKATYHVIPISKLPRIVSRFGVAGDWPGSQGRGGGTRAKGNQVSF